jgi:hypothetical protein
VRRADLVARGAFGALCIAGMCLLAIPLLLTIGPTGAIINLIEGDQWRAFWVWVGSWLAMGVAGILFFVTAYVSWPLASDWITEWQGYAIAFAIGAAGLGLMILTVFFTTWPLAIELLLPLAATFLLGCLLPGRLLGLGRSSALPLERRRHQDRRRTRKRAETQ